MGRVGDREDQPAATAGARTGGARARRQVGLCHDIYVECDRPVSGVEDAWVVRGALKGLVRHPPRRLVIQTRSSLIERDLDMIGRLCERVIASITLETDDDAVRCATTISRGRTAVEVSLKMMVPAEY